MECPQCANGTEKTHRFCPECGQRLGRVFGLTAPQMVAIMAAVIAADVISFAFTNGASLAVGIPVTIALLLIFLSRPKWAVTLPSDKWT